MEDYFRVAARWFQEVKTDTALRGGGPALYPFLIWNCLWPAGSSILHGHLQLTVAQRRPYPRLKQLLDCSTRYGHRYGSNYFQDLYTLYKALGLGWEKGESRFLSMLTPIKEKEVWILLPPGPATPYRLGQAGRAVGRVLVFKVASLPAASMWGLPPGEKNPEAGSFPVVRLWTAVTS